MSVAAILLAAGGSSRLGHPKQLLPFRGRTLLAHAAEAAAHSGCLPLVVVLGASAEACREELRDVSAQIVVNTHWQEGIASSIRLGVETALERAPEASAVVLLLCDQPALSSRAMDDLIAAHRATRKGIAASSYNDTLGAPALFSREYFPALIALRGDEGAKRVIAEHEDDVAAVPFPDGAADIDTAADWERHAEVLTIGHSTRPIEEFIALLKAHGATCVIDVRTIPGSRRNPQFNRETLPVSLKAAGLGYMHMPELGGLRRPRPDSPNAGWKNASFRGFADYMQTPEFDAALESLIELAKRDRLALMCAEAVSWRCHRSLIADALVVRGIPVAHIMTKIRRDAHVLRSFAKRTGLRISYPPA